MAAIVDDLLEWDYGDCRGPAHEDIRKEIPGWSVWTHRSTGWRAAGRRRRPRADRVIATPWPTGLTIMFAHAHILRILAARWCGLDRRRAAS